MEVMKDEEIVCSVRKITDMNLLHEIIEFVLDIPVSTMTSELLYERAHSIQRTQMFLIKMIIPSEVSVHFRTHSANGVFHYVSSGRADWGGLPPEKTHRRAKVRHVIICNAESLRTILSKRLCTPVLKSTKVAAERVRVALRAVDPTLHSRVNEPCYAENGICKEGLYCGKHVRNAELRKAHSDQVNKKKGGKSWK